MATVKLTLEIAYDVWVEKTVEIDPLALSIPNVVLCFKEDKGKANIYDEFRVDSVTHTIPNNAYNCVVAWMPPNGPKGTSEEILGELRERGWESSEGM